jgi:hypothetical protein
MMAIPIARAVWQVSGGPGNRSYVDVFLRHGVALIGPGDAGAWSAERDDGEYEGGFVRRFATEPHEGDPVLLRTGTSRVRAVGVVASAYQFLNQFDDVNGRDIQHARRVRWKELPTEYDFGSPVFGANPPRFSRIHADTVVDYAHRFVNSPPQHWQDAALPDLPAEEPALGEVPEALRGVLAEVHDLLPLLNDRERFGEQPTEDELVAHFVVPFLRALGWPPERIAIKWRFVDVCLFDTLPRTPESVRYIIEAKRLGAGVEGALTQARGYLEALGIVRDVVVTDGVRYRMYAGDRDFEPVAYANLARLKQPATNLFTRMKRP